MQIKLVSFEKAKESWQLDADAKLEQVNQTMLSNQYQYFLLQAKIFKEKGTVHFKLNKYEVASTRYQKIIDFLEHEISLKGDFQLNLPLNLTEPIQERVRRRGKCCSRPADSTSPSVISSSDSGSRPGMSATR